MHCIQNLNYGGMERVLSDLVHGVDPERFDPHVLTLQYRGRYSADLDRVATLHDGPKQGPLSLIWPRALTRTIESIAPDVVHLHSGVWYKAALASRRAGVPRIIYTEHGRVGPEAFITRTLDSLASRRTDRVVAVSTATAHQLTVGPGIARERIDVIPNGIDTNRFAPGPSTFRADRGFSDDVVLLGSVGRLEPVKGYPHLLEAFRRVLDRVGDQKVHLVMAGDGSERERLEEQSAALGLGDHLTFLGWWDDPEGLLRALDVFVMSSISEGTSISLLEALSSECCPVVTRVGGNPDVLGPDLAHRLVESADPDSIADGLVAACTDADARASDARTGRARVQSDFEVRGMVEAYSRLYDA
jgi:glycosyltransferase involved in cell wall biosynthesis